MMLRDDFYKIDVFETDEQEKVISEDICEIYTVFKYISTQLSYNSKCLRGLKILDIGCATGENCNLAINHGASFVAGIDLTASVIQAAHSNFSKAGIDPSQFFFTKANIFSSQSAELNLPSSQFEGFFDKVMSFWVISQAKSLNDVREVFNIAKKYVKPKGDIAILVVNPLIIANFPAVKRLPRIENFRLVEVTEENDHFKMKSQILHPITEEVIMEVHHNIYSIEQLSQAIENSGLQIKHSGNLELNQRDDELRYPFEMISQEISRDITMGYFFHIRKPE